MILSLHPLTETLNAAGSFPYLPTTLELHSVTETLSTHLIAFLATDQITQVVVGPLKFSLHLGSQQGVN